MSHEIHTHHVRLAPGTRYRLRKVMRTSIQIRRVSGLIAITAAIGTMTFALSGCGGSSTQSAQAVAHRTAVTAKSQQKIDPSAHPLNDMVAAVSAGKAGPPVEVKFELRDRPHAGEPVDIDIAVQLDAPTISRVYAKFQGGEGVTVVEGEELTQIDRPTAGSVIRHVVRIVPKEDGIFALSATVSIDLADDSLTRTFSIPVIVGEGLPGPPAKAEVADGQSGPGTVAKTH